MDQGQQYGNVSPYSGGKVVDRNPGAGLAVWVGTVVGEHYLVMVEVGLGVLEERVGWRGLLAAGWVVVEGLG